MQVKEVIVKTDYNVNISLSLCLLETNGRLIRLNNRVEYKLDTFKFSDSNNYPATSYSIISYKIHENKCLVLGFDEVNLLFVCVRFNAPLMCSNNLEARKSESLN